MNVSAFEFLTGNEYGIVTAIDHLARDNYFESFISSGRMLAVCLLIIISAFDLVVYTFKSFKAFSKKRSSDLKYLAINSWMHVVSAYTWLAILGRGNSFEGFNDWQDFYTSDTMSAAIIVATGMLLISAFVSLAKGFSLVPSKKPCWWSSALLSAVYSIIALSMTNLSISGLFSSAAAGIGMIDSEYAVTNSKFECFLIAVFNVFIIVTFFRLKNHVRSTLVSEMGCALGFGQGYVKTSPMASTRVKAAIMPAISIFAVAVLTNEETAILWPVFGLNKFLIKTVILLIIAALICKKLRDKTFYSAK
jgi:hypothetical protein